MIHVKLVNTSAMSENPSVPATLDTSLLVMDLVASNVLPLTSIVTVKSLHYHHGMLLFVVTVIPVSQMIAVEQ